MKCNPLISMPIAIGLFALASSQVFSTIGKLAIEHERRSAGQSAELVNANNRQDPGEQQNDRIYPGALTVQQLHILDPNGRPVIMMAGTEQGAVIEMRSSTGERVMGMFASTTGSFQQLVHSGDDVVAHFATEPDRGTYLRFSSPGRHATIAAHLQTGGSTLTAFNTLRMNPRAGLYQLLSLSGATFEGREYLPGQMVSTITDLATRESFQFSEHSLYTLEQIEAAMSEAIPDDE